MTRYPSNRERLMDAAGELFYREGLHAITADRVADSAGLTKPTIYNLFGSKDALVARHSSAVRSRYAATSSSAPPRMTTPSGSSRRSCKSMPRC